MTRRMAAWLWSALVVGPLAWLIALEANYAFVHLACVSRTKLILFIVGILAFGATLAGVVVAWRARPAVGSGPATTGVPTESPHFMMHAGLWLSAFFVIVMIAGALPIAMLPVCD